MKKLFTLLAMMIATVTSFAATYTHSLWCSGGYMFGDTPLETQNVTLTVTEDADGTYTFNFGKFNVNSAMGEMTLSDELKMTGVTAKELPGGYTKYSSTYSNGTYGSDDYTMTAVSDGNDIYFKLEGKIQYWPSVVLVFGDEIVAPEETSSTTTFSHAAQVVYKGNSLDMTSLAVDVTKAEDDTYTFAIKDLQVTTTVDDQPQTITLGTLTVTGVLPTDEDEGITTYDTADGAKAVVSGLSTEAIEFLSVAEGDELPIVIEAASKDDQMQGKFTITIGSQKCVVLYNGYEDSTEWSGPAVVTYWNTDYDYSEQVVEVAKTDEAENLYTITVKDLTISNTVIADITAENVKGTENADGSITYEFDGEGYLSNIGVAYSSSFSEGDKIPLTIAAIENGDSFKALFTTTLTGNELTLNFCNYVAPVKPTTYKADAISYWSDGDTQEVEGSHPDKTAYVYANEDGTYKFVLPEVAFYQQDTDATEKTLADFTIDNVEVTENADGSYSFDFSGNATTANADQYAVNAEHAVTFKGSFNGEDLYYVLSCTIWGMYDFTYTFGEEPETPVVIEGTAVVEDGYAPAGTKFVETAKIDWESQKLVANIDVTTCTGSYENILSVGKDIANWNGECFHLYYSRSSKALQVNYCTASGNPIRMEKTVDADVLNVEISKANGITVNGESWNYENDNSYTGDLTDDMSVYSVLWGLSEIQVGSQEGNNRSNATYNYVRVQDIPVSVTDTESHQDVMTVTEPSTQETTIENASLDILTYSDGSYGVTLYNVQGEETDLGDITVTGLNKQEDEGNTYYTGEQEITVNGETMTVAVAGVKYPDGNVWFTVELVTNDYDVYSIEYGAEQQTFDEGKAYEGSWKVNKPEATFNGTVDVIEQSDGYYALRVHDFQINGTVVPTFVVPNLEGYLENGKLSIGEMSRIDVVYEGTVEDANKVTYVTYVTVTLENGELYVNFSYVGNASTELTMATFTASSTGISAINADALNGKADIYTVAGAKVNAMQKGINLVRANGKTVKIVKK